MFSPIPAKRLLFLAVFCLLSITATLANTSGEERLAELDQQLALLLPGTSTQEQSARAYAKARINDVLLILENRNIQRKKPAKALQIIQEEIERAFLHRYQYFADINLLFKSGHYDQTTATALYALTMSYFSLPYTLEIRDADILLIAELGEVSQQLSIPGGNDWNPEASLKFQNAYLELLKSIGYLSLNEWNQSPKMLFQSNYLGDISTINLQQMASFLYYRQALQAYADKAWASALDWLHRAEQLQDWPLHHVLRRAIWLQLACQKDNNRESLHYLWKIWQNSPGAPWQGELLQRFNLAIVDHPMPNSWTIDSTYAHFQDKFSGYPAALGQLREMYYLQSARFHAKAGNTTPMMHFMDSLYNLRPNDRDIQEVLAGMLVWSLQSERAYTKGLQRVNENQLKYPFLKSNLLFQDRHLFYQAERIRFHFDQEDGITGLRYIEEFKNLAIRIAPTPRYASWVSTAYIAASNFYFRSGNYRQALNWIEQARQEAPLDPYLDHRADVLLKYLR